MGSGVRGPIADALLRPVSLGREALELVEDRPGGGRTFDSGTSTFPPRGEERAR